MSVPVQIITIIWSKPYQESFEIKTQNSSQNTDKELAFTFQAKFVCLLLLILHSGFVSLFFALLGFELRASDC
jgi:hypothetical protein